MPLNATDQCFIHANKHATVLCNVLKTSADDNLKLACTLNPHVDMYVTRERLPTGPAHAPWLPQRCTPFASGCTPGGSGSPHVAPSWQARADFVVAADSVEHTINAIKRRECSVARHTVVHCASGDQPVGHVEADDAAQAVRRSARSGVVVLCRIAHGIVIMFVACVLHRAVLAALGGSGEPRSRLIVLAMPGVCVVPFHVAIALRAAWPEIVLIARGRLAVAVNEAAVAVALPYAAFHAVQVVCRLAAGGDAAHVGKLGCAERENPLVGVVWAL
eukprot:363568-Chlamydomonas_euryale.AAC.5